MADLRLICAFCGSLNVRNTETDSEDVFWSLCDDCEEWTEYPSELDEEDKKHE